jgi:hypothetical protein
MQNSIWAGVYYFMFSNQPSRVVLRYQCTPQELAVLLPAFHKIAMAFDPVESPPDVGFKSSVLNDIIFSLPKLKGPMTELMGAVSLKKAAEGSKDSIWTDTERYPKITNAVEVRSLTPDSLTISTYLRARLFKMLKVNLWMSSKAVRWYHPCHFLSQCRFNSTEAIEDAVSQVGNRCR